MTTTRDSGAAVPQAPLQSRRKQSQPRAGLPWGETVPGRAEQAAAKRLAILRAAADLFNERGFRESSLDELAQRLHVTKPTLYYYVKSKDDILLQCLGAAMGAIDPILATLEHSESTGLEKLRHFVRGYIDILTGDFGRCLVLTGFGPLDHASRRKLRPAYRRIDGAVRKVIVEGIQDGSIARCDPKIAAFTLFGAMHWLTHWYRPNGQWTPAEIADRMLDLFEQGLAPGTTRAPSSPR
jgi:AcrR family transcriptional regulator